MTANEAYMKLQDGCGIEVGNKVTVLRKAKSGELGWGCSWNSSMLRFVGNVYTVTNITREGILLNDTYYFPWYVLELTELTEKKKEVKEMTVSEISNALGYKVKVI